MEKKEKKQKVVKGHFSKKKRSMVKLAVRHLTVVNELSKKTLIFEVTYSNFSKTVTFFQK